MTISTFIDLYLFSNIDLIIRAAFALLVGFILGYEREYRAKPAGVKTYAMICLGATIITYMSLHISSHADASRMAAQIVSGLGFIGAGAIFQSKRIITGLTTAATLWVVGSLGILIGAGYIVDALIALLLIYMFFVFTKLIQKPNRRRIKRHIAIKVKSKRSLDKVNQLILEKDIEVFAKTITKAKHIKLELTYITTQSSNQSFVESLLKLRNIVEVQQ